jgi:hypothetical protein
MITFITYGAGMFLGSWLSGKVVDLYAGTCGSGRGLPCLAVDLVGAGVRFRVGTGAVPDHISRT